MPTVGRVLAMLNTLRTIDQHLKGLSPAGVLTLSVFAVLVIGCIDYLTGYEVGISLFYLGPVAIAAWFGPRRVGIAIAILSAVSWYIADLAAGNYYSHPAIPVWNAFVRFGFFLITGALLTVLRDYLRIQAELARTDGLTGLYGRRAFEERLKHDLALGQRRKSAFTIAYVDLDDFKAVNDTQGHAGGDRLLRLIGDVLQSSVRMSDTPARLGGDEFALLMPDTDDSGARQVISKLNQQLQEALGAINSKVTYSMGVVTFLDSATSPERALVAADELMYRVKHSGKGAVAFSVVA